MTVIQFKELHVISSDNRNNKKILNGRADKHPSMLAGDSSSQHAISH